ncbi:putative eukaryotic translation initiation factor 5 [Mycena sanguinolenta]|uniref:Putative eukaryotic translation initiation factor 5 n=1 Tax=Mycena sanguinolenta TaxID=230812 RepID=A0A8H6Y4R9_9AGAR|nr:putative eukaryotic translation initiation factor 5 [Mycena sanguinolenta]
MLSTRAFFFASLFLLCQYVLFTQWYQCSPRAPVTESMSFPSPIPLPVPDTPPLPAVMLPADGDVSDPPFFPQRRHRIAVATTYSPHMDVYMSFAWTLQRVMDRKPFGGTVEVYAPPFPYGFQTIVERLGLYRGVVQKPDTFLDAMNDNVGDGGIDIVVLGTCEADLKSAWGESLLSAWDARDPGHKFSIVCLVHNGPENTPQGTLESFSRRNAIRILTISSQCVLLPTPPISHFSVISVASTHRRSFLARADNPDPVVRSAGYEFIPVDVYVPVLDIPLSQDKNNQNSGRFLSNAVIQGNFDRRNNQGIFTDLIESMAEDPQAWGYLPLDPTNATAAYVADPTLTELDEEPPFRLWLVGSGPQPEIPHELANIVQIHSRLAYSDFYALISSMDIVVPALPQYSAYYDTKASSTFALALECNLPVIATTRARLSYTHIDDDRVVIKRPAFMSEVDVLRALRTRSASHFFQKTATARDSPAGKAVEDMVRLGWARGAEDSVEVKRRVWEANEAVVERVLAGDAGV